VCMCVCVSQCLCEFMRMYVSVCVCDEDSPKSTCYSVYHMIIELHVCATKATQARMQVKCVCVCVRV